ncbi:tRNA-dihydrouridine(20a/20b) synthase [NAD(P)+]-like isoform X2 [Hyalella azteca]|nr:tRNA-dihydrouridine(20a/20b) synthase [NAD(P)+]-like isoform X2 [Hyalella azteca]
MIVSDSFVKSEKARHSDFSTSTDDRPLIVQFAASNAESLASAAALVAPHSSGCDLNCGCPQRWAMQEGYGACLIHKPELVAEMVRRTRAVVANPHYTISVKIRIHKDTRSTVSLCRQLEAAGVSFLTVHARTSEQRSEPVDLETLAAVVSAVDVPVVANGDIRSLEDAHRVQRITGVRGVMAARGLLANPAMFAGEDYTPLSCVEDWIKISLETGAHFTNFHHHLIYMLDKQLSRAERRYFNSLASVVGVTEYLREKYDLNL